MVAVGPCGPCPSHRVLAVEPSPPPPVTLRRRSHPTEALAQRSSNDPTHHHATRQAEANDKARPPVDELLDVVRSAIKHPAVAGHRLRGCAAVLVAALSAQPISPNMGRAEPCGQRSRQSRLTAARAADDHDPVSIEQLASQDHSAIKTASATCSARTHDFRPDRAPNAACPRVSPARSRAAR